MKTSQETIEECVTSGMTEESEQHGAHRKSIEIEDGYRTFCENDLKRKK